MIGLSLLIACSHSEPFTNPDTRSDGRIEGRGELFPLYVSAARDVSQPVFFHGPPRLVRLGVEVLF
jgi:hypothetical protein